MDRVPAVKAGPAAGKTDFGFNLVTAVCASSLRLRSSNDTDVQGEGDARIPDHCS